MSLSDFAITQKYPPADPSVLQLYSFPTPNGVKVSIALEEVGLAYEAHTVKLNETTTPEFLSLNPNNKIPAILDPDGPDGAPLALWESGAILLYLAQKTGKLMPQGAAAQAETVQWLMFQMGGVGPMFGQLGFFHRFAGKEIEDPRPKERYVSEASRLLKVLDARLDGRDWIMGETYTIADIALWPWVRALDKFYEAGPLVGLDKMANVSRWMEAGIARPASQVGLNVPPRDG
ncbi:MAG: glutathione S-transferase N-terminal domain-containing protein [Pseudomonadota bacterium]